MTRVKIGITQGDINGISYEVIIKAFSDSRIYDSVIPVLYGSPKVFAYYKKLLNNAIPVNTISSPTDAKLKCVNIINCNNEDIRVEQGKSTQMAGLAAFQALQKAVKDIKTGGVDALVTAPINKKNIQEAGFKFTGHTEYLAKEFGDVNTIMLMLNDFIKIGVVTEHIPINRVAETITKSLIMSKLTALNDTLTSDFLIDRPRIAVLSLNPHAGDEGVIGDEEAETIIPSIEMAVQQEILAFGPYSPDGFFGSGEYRKFDAVLAMYHDQGLIPFKILAAGSGINFTGGLPIVRTSPAHGTAYNIAGKRVANETSFRAAINTAVDIFRNRKEEFELQSKRLQVNDLESMKATSTDEEQ